MPSKPMEEKQCDITGCPHPIYKHLSRHMTHYHDVSTPSPEPPVFTKDQSLAGGSTSNEWGDVDAEMKKVKLKGAKGIAPVKPTGKKGGGKMLGIGRFFITMSKWLNATICKNPQIIMDEATAKELEQQFNDAFGIYFEPIVAFAGSIFWIFVIPVLLNLFGEEIITKLILKFKDGIFNKLSGDSDDTI